MRGIIQYLWRSWIKSRHGGRDLVEFVKKADIADDEQILVEIAKGVS
jgi:hypothetical protein